MKSSTIAFLLLSYLLVNGCHQADEPIQSDLPLTTVEGYGPFHPGFSALGNKHSNDVGWQKQWGKMYAYLSVKGVPTNWTAIQKDMVWLNTYQLIYQNFLAGNFTKEQYLNLQESWKWSPDTTRLSKNPIKCYVHTLTGYDEKAGKWAAMIDTNNNLDFSDETPIYPAIIDFKDPYTYRTPSIVQYELFRDGKTVKATVPMVIKMMGSDFLYNFPQYAEATFEQSGKTYSLAIMSGSTRPDFESPSLIDLSTLKTGQRATESQLINLNENIVLNGITYKNKGVDFYRNVLRLEPVDNARKEYALQVGYPFKPFTEQDFTTKRLIKFTNLKGKYIYVDFWGTWCQGCVEDIPDLKKMYQTLDKNRFEFIGIVSDSPQRLTAFVEENDVRWPQILSTSSNHLVDNYAISGYPTSVLIDPSGTVVSRNLRPKELALKLRELGN